MRRILTEENGISELGEKIPGGIRIAFDEVVEGDEVVIDQISPPLMIYDPKDRGENIKKIRPDLRILAPREKIEFQQVSENEKLPRGLGKKSIFSEPILKLASGGEEGLKSISLEFDNFAEDDPDELGSAYFNAIAEAFEADLVSVLSDCESLYGDFGDLPEDAQEIIANMMFNMGRPRLSKFKGMKRGVDARDWNAAADEMVDSTWYRQVTNRAERLVRRMRNV